jgi:hypothetical protein
MVFVSDVSIERLHRQPLPPPVEGDASLPYDITNIRNHSIAVTGEVFRWIVDFASPQVLERVRLLPSLSTHPTNNGPDACLR